MLPTRKFVSGIIGSYVVVKRIVFIAGSISHAVLSGIGFCIWLERVHGVEQASPLYGALGAAIFSALIMGWIRLYYHQREDSAIAAIWSIGMALGILFISQTPGFNVELTNEAAMPAKKAAKRRGLVWRASRKEGINDLCFCCFAVFG
jgi:zinc transport system permease protein